VVAVLPGKGNEGERFHEVFRLIPKSGTAVPGGFRHLHWTFRDGVVHLRDIVLPAVDVHKGMCLFPQGNDFVMGAAEMPLAPPHHRRVPPFYLDTTEVAAGPYSRWLHGPMKRYPRLADPTLAATAVTWNHAVAYAETIGKRLPDETEYEYAATACGKWRFPWGNEPRPVGSKWTFGPVGQPDYDRVELPGQPPVFGLYSNVAEWTSSRAGGYPCPQPAEPEPRLRVVRGAPYAVVRGQNDLPGEVRGPRERLLVVTPMEFSGLGFRCARSARPRLTARDFVTVLGR
jgi:formylglycine-generating enzyme required for sulfatase activity